MSGSPLSTPQPWELVAPAYASEIVPRFETYAREALRLAAPPPGARIVDVACGPGTLAVLAARAGHLVDALDFAPAMLAALEARIVAEHLTGVTPWLGDGEALPFPTGVYAAGFSMFGLMFFPDRARGFAELRRVLAPGARAVVASWQPLDHIPSFVTVFEALRAFMPMPANGTSEGPLTTVEHCREEMASAFADVEVHAVAHTDHWPTPVAMWESMKRATAPVLLLRDRLSPERWLEADATVRHELARAFGTGPIESTMPAWLTVGTAR